MLPSLVLLLIAFAWIPAYPVTFDFEHHGKKVEGYLIMPAGTPRALVLYFHRAIEDREAVRVWAELLGPRGYAVAGFTATGIADVATEAEIALRKLRSRKEISAVPVFIMGASLGTRAASLLFSRNADVSGVILIVPSLQICDALKTANGRPVLMIEAEKDEVVRSPRKEILRCIDRGAKYHLLKGESHRFPPALVAPIIIQWLEEIL